MISNRRSFRLFSGKTGSAFQVEDIDGKVVTSDELPSLSTLLSGPGPLEATAASSNDTGRTAAAPSAPALQPLVHWRWRESAARRS